MSRVLVTGGAGFLGSHLTDLMLSHGHHVVGMDNLVTGSRANIAHLDGRADYSFIEHDVSTYIDLDGDVDYILHFASPASPIDYLQLPIQTLKVGALGTHNVLGLARVKGARVVLASTSEVYGDPLVHPQHEAKRFAEAMTMAYHRYHGVETRIVRIFNTYGPRMRLDDGRALPAFMCQALRGEPLTVFGDGSQTRSFCYVSDLCEGIFRLMMSDETEPVNIGNPTEISIGEFAITVIDLVGGASEVEYHDLPVDDPKVRRPNIDRARKILGWEPEVDLATGLARTLEDFKGRLDA